MQPITRQQQRNDDGRKAASIYARRRDIDNWHEQRRVERETREVYET
ncbi:hypothetical protein HLV40_07265 [Chromohalobacter salexigens]|nr:hypothetical protein [Chromohalobacter salexigens]